MNNNLDLFMFDQCYERPTVIEEPSFNATLLNSYNKYVTRTVRDCEIKALRSNSDFFLINDISSLGNITYTNCYIPKQDYNTPSAIIGDNSVIAKALNLFSSTFNPFTKQIDSIDTCNNLLYNSGPNNPNKCFKYSIDKKIYAPKKYYAYYKKPIINEANRTISLQDPGIYKRNVVPLKSYDNLLIIDNRNFIDNGTLAAGFKSYICAPTLSNERYLDEQIIKLKQHYESLFNELDRINADISSVNYLNSFDNETIIGLNVRISNKNKELNSLLGFGGANNGRLYDTTFLTQFKIVENSILLLIIVTAIFAYNKLKHIKL
jgi:hypothetical protein